MLLNQFLRKFRSDNSRTIQRLVDQPLQFCFLSLQPQAEI